MYYAYYSYQHLYLRRCGGGDTIRFLNHPHQIKLVEKYYGSAPLEVCSLNHFDLCQMHKAQVVLDTMLRIPANPMVGGWRTLEEPEANALMLGTCPPPVGKLPQVSGIPAQALSSIDRHPAIRSGLAFIHGGVIPLSLLSLLVFIYDIRRFANPDHPLRFSHMKSYFRLTNPTTLFKFFEQKQATTATVRPSLAFSAWYCGPLQKMPRELIEELPYAFLFRETFRLVDEYRKQYDEETAKGMAMWRTTSRMLNMVRMLWNTGISGIPFIPEKFFRTEAESKCFREYINKLDFGVDNVVKWL